MYKCAMCKEDKLGEPAMTNACGPLCALCKAAMHAKSLEACQRRVGELSGRCRWCGLPITPETQQHSGEHHDGGNVCQPCAKHRDWLRACILHSDHPATYVASHEQRAAPIRKNRQIAQAVTVKPITETESVAVRMERMERMMNKLAEKLGV